jgi:hypothetical protein
VGLNLDNLDNVLLSHLDLVHLVYSNVIHCQYVLPTVDVPQFFLQLELTYVPVFICWTSEYFVGNGVIHAVILGNNNFIQVFSTGTVILLVVVIGCYRILCRPIDKLCCKRF